MSKIILPKNQIITPQKESIHSRIEKLMKKAGHEPPNCMEDLESALTKYHNCLSDVLNRADRLYVQLAGCTAAAMGYAGKCKEGDYGWSPSFEKVKEFVGLVG